jgi:NitT/TauT family transport system permease protein
VRTLLQNRLSIVIPIITFGIFLVGWSLLIWAGSLSPLIFPSPSAVLNIIVQKSGYLLFHTSITGLEAVLGFLLGSSTGFALATLFIFSRLAEQALYPYAIAIKAIPLVALAPIIVTWSGTGLISKVILAAIIAFFPVLVNSLDGLQSIEPEALELFQSWSASQWQIFVKLRIFHALPAIFAGLKISSSFAIVGAVVAEFTGAEQGIGFVIKQSSYYLETDLTFASIIFSSLIGLTFFALITLLEKRIVFWQTESTE